MDLNYKDYSGVFLVIFMVMNVDMVGVLKIFFENGVNLNGKDDSLGYMVFYEVVWMVVFCVLDFGMDIVWYVWNEIVLRFFFEYGVFVIVCSFNGIMFFYIVVMKLNI